MPHTGIALPPGATLQEYRIASTLGMGGFGVTYLAVDENLDLKVALKEFLPGDLAFRGEDQSLRLRTEDSRKTFDWGRRRFLDEARTLASFRHPSIVRVMRFFEANATAYMVMEFVEGQTLQQWIKGRRPVPEPVVLALASALLEGLEVVHGGGYLHRDIKPGNIFIRRDGTPVLLDFGSARATGGAGDLTVIVSPGYAPLEQYHAQGHQGPWSDLYALGGVLYWMVTGTNPLEAPARARRDPMPPALEAGERSLYRAGLLRAIDWALAPAEEDRPQVAAELRAALERLGQDPADEVATFLAGGQGLPFPDPPPPASGSVPSGPVPSGPAPSGPSTTGPFDGETLKRVTAGLASHLGPIAGVVVKAAAKRCGDLPALLEAVAAEIADDRARSAFLKAFAEAKSGPASAPSSGPASGPGSSPPSGPAPSGPPAGGLDPGLLARAETELARHLGAVAKVVVRRAAARAPDAAGLLKALAGEIEDPAARRAFLARMQG